MVAYTFRKEAPVHCCGSAFLLHMTTEPLLKNILLFTSAYLYPVGDHPTLYA